MTDDRYKRARQRVEDLRGFYSHLMMFVLVNALLFVIDVVSGDSWWFYWPLLGWGIGLCVHAFSVFRGGPFGPEWEDRKIRQIMERDGERHPPAPTEGPSTQT